MKIIQKVHAGDYVAAKLSDKLNAFLIGRRKITRFSAMSSRKIYTYFLMRGNDASFLSVRISNYKIKRVKYTRNKFEHNIWKMMEINIGKSQVRLND